MGNATPIRAAGAVFATIAIAAAGPATPARADTPEEKFVADLKHANEVVTSIPGTPEQWIIAGYASCDRISSAVAQGLRLQAAINNEVVATGAFNVISRQNSVAIVTYAVLDLCPQVIPNRNAGAPPPPPPPGT